MKLTKTVCAMLAATLAGTLSLPVVAADRPAEIRLGMTTYLSGSASVFGVPAHDGVQIYVDEMNKNGGIGGVPVKLEFIDEGGGSDKLLSEYRRLAEGGVDGMLASISSGNCLVVAPVAEDLKVVNDLWDCGTQKALEKKTLSYVVRTQANATAEMVAQVIYLIKKHPDFKTLAIVNQDYAWGHDSHDIFLAALKKFKPDVKVVATMFPKFGSSDFSTEISRLQALRPDVILSTSWGGDLDNFVRQASQRNLFRNSTFVLSLAESSLERLGDSLPEGVIIGARGDHYFLHPETRDDSRHKDFVKKFREKTGHYPIYSVYHMIQALEGYKAGYEKAIKDNNGAWPNAEQLARAMHHVTFKGFGRAVSVDRADGQGIEAQLFGITTSSGDYPFKVLKDMMIVPGEMVTPPDGQDSFEWIERNVGPEMLKSDKLKSFD
ncbi:MAG: ABC transporter substrate-binding protein [Castellaniella sp.]|uniref:ABC transporter substrate-binding protein n=1 Tax=Castellaniella sp. TaxID=1955812 RepID=UPI003A88A665